MSLDHAPFGIKLCHSFTRKPAGLFVTLGQEASCQHPACQRVVHNPVKPVPAQRRDKVVLGRTVDGVVCALVQRGPNIALVFAYEAYFGNLRKMRW